MALNMLIKIAGIFALATSVIMSCTPSSPLPAVSKIVGIAQGEMVAPGTTRLLFVSLVGGPDLTIRWEDKNGPIPNSNQTSLEYTIPDTGGDAIITVIVTDKMGQMATATTTYQIVLPTATLTPTAASISATLSSGTTTATFTATLTETPPPTSTPSPDLTTEAENHLIQLIDDYYTCFNRAAHNNRDDYMKCWNMLSSLPGEFQENLTAKKGGFQGFFEFWNKYKVAYSLYYCPNGSRQFVGSTYNLFDWDNLSTPIGNGTTFLLEYQLEVSNSGWRIKGATVPLQLSSYCEDRPRVQKSPLSP
jgi:hypothetical protein